MKITVYKNTNEVPKCTKPIKGRTNHTWVLTAPDGSETNRTATQVCRCGAVVKGLANGYIAPRRTNNKGQRKNDISLNNNRTYLLDWN
jgi:hypothetical protein